MDGNDYLLQRLINLGIHHYFGVNGGGIFSLTRQLPPYNTTAEKFYFSLHEYIAGFASIGHYLVHKQIAATLVTTGVAIKLALCAASDAKFMGIPAVYIVALSPHTQHHQYPIQDTSSKGMATIEFCRAEFPNHCIVVDDLHQLDQQLEQLQILLENHQPVILLLYPDVLNQPFVATQPKLHDKYFPRGFDQLQLERFIKLLENKQYENIVLFACTEATVELVPPRLFARLAKKLNAKVIYTVNGDNTACLTTSQNLGHIMLGANESAVRQWHAMDENTILICLGYDAYEYAVNHEQPQVQQVVCFTRHTDGYGQRSGSYKHHFPGDYLQINGVIADNIVKFLELAQDKIFPHLFQREILSKSIIDDTIALSADFINPVKFYRRLEKLWRANTIVFEDVCMAYRDRQAICLQPSKYCRIFSANHGSSMGSAFGMGVGAAVAKPCCKVFVFSGDGCFRYVVGGLAETARLNITLVIFDNSRFGIVDLFPFDKKYDGVIHKHTDLVPIDWQKVGEGFGWKVQFLQPDLSNLDVLLADAYQQDQQSNMIIVPTDPQLAIGKNFRNEQILKV